MYQVDIELPNTIGVTKTSEVKKTAIEAMGCVANLIFGTGGSTSLTLFYICPSQIIDCDGNVYNVSEQYFASWEYGEFEAGTYVDLVGTGEIFLDVPVGAMRRYTMVAVLQNGSLIDETNGLIYSRVVPIDSSISDITFGDFLLSTYMVTIQTSAVSIVDLLLQITRAEEFCQNYVISAETSVDKSENSPQFSYIILR